MISRQTLTLIHRLKTTNHLFQLQALLIKTALDHQETIFSNLILSSASISIQLSRKIFDNSPTKRSSLFAWNTLIKEYSKSSVPVEAVKLFVMLRRVGLKPDRYTYPFVLKGCGRCSMIGVGRTVHSAVLKTGFDCDLHISNTLLRMYAACDAILFSRQVFDKMPERDVVSWSSMIAAYVDCHCPLDAVAVFQGMLLENSKPNSITLVSLLSACTDLLNLKLGESIHSHIVTNGIELHVELGTAILEMYAKCGHIREAFCIFNSMLEKNLQSWTVMISGLADNGHGEEGLSLFSKMEEVGLEPDSKSFSAILSACSHMGLVDEGQNYFDKMVRVHKIKPTLEHFGCMVDMFGRAGMIEEAYRMIKSMPMEPNSVVLRTYISACINHGRVWCEDDNLMEKLLQIEPNLGSNYVLAASMSSVLNYHVGTLDLRLAMKGKGLNKVPGSSWVDTQGAAIS